MTIMIAGDKGGTGKSPLAYIIASYLGYDIYSNEATVNEKYYPKVKKFLPEFKVVNGIRAKIPTDMPIAKNTVYDFAGEINHVAIDVAKHADIIIIPSTEEEDSVFKSANAMFSFGKVARADSVFILVATRITESKKNKEVLFIKKNVEATLNHKIAKLLNVTYAELPEKSRANFKFFKIRENKLFRYLRDNKLSFANLEEVAGLQKKNWRNVIEETTQLLDYIDKIKVKRG